MRDPGYYNIYKSFVDIVVNAGYAGLCSQCEMDQPGTHFSKNQKCKF